MLKCTKKLKLNIQRTTTIFVAVVFSLSVVAFAASEPGQLKMPEFVHRLKDFPTETEQLPDRLEEVTVDLQGDPAYTWEITSPVKSGWYSTYDNAIDLEWTATSGGDPGTLLMTGYFWPLYERIDITELTDPTALKFDYSCNFELLLEENGAGGDGTGSVYISLVPRIRLLRETGGQVAFINGTSVWTELSNPKPSDLVLPVTGSQSIDLSLYHDGYEFWTNVSQIEIKWQFNIRVEDVDLYNSVNFHCTHNSTTLTYIREREKNQAEIFQDEMTGVTDVLGDIGEAMEAVPKPSEQEIATVIKPVDQLVDVEAMSTISGVMGAFTGASIILTYLTIMCSVVMVSYILFGKKG